MWFIFGLGIFIVAVIAFALLAIKYARSCLLGEKGASSSRPHKVAPNQGSTRQGLKSRWKHVKIL